MINLTLNKKVIIFGFIFTFFSSFGQSFFLGLFNAPIRNELGRTIWARVMPLHFKIITSIIRFLNIPLKESNSTPFPVPDGICLDSDNGIWVASPTTAEVIRYKKGGKITDRIATPQPAYACMLGGKDEKELYILTAESSNPQFCKENKTGEIHKVEVNYERAGEP